MSDLYDIDNQMSEFEKKMNSQKKFSVLGYKMTAESAFYTTLGSTWYNYFGSITSFRAGVGVNFAIGATFDANINATVTYQRIITELNLSKKEISKDKKEISEDKKEIALSKSSIYSEDTSINLNKKSISENLIVSCKNSISTYESNLEDSNLLLKKVNLSIEEKNNNINKINMSIEEKENQINSSKIKISDGGVIIDGSKISMSTNETTIFESDTIILN